MEPGHLIFCLGEAGCTIVRYVSSQNKNTNMSYTSCLYHIVIRTKRSEPTITAAYEREVYAYIFTLIKSYDCIVYRINGMPDQIHILINLHPTRALSDLMRELKVSTSKMMKADRNKFPMFDGWEGEYYATTIGKERLEEVRQYIIGQKEHHKKINTHDELLALCKEHGIEVNEKYL